MGGLKKYMPITWGLMWAATLAIAGIPPFSGFFSKDSILGATFERAGHSTLADASLFGIPGSTLLYMIYVFGLAAAFLTAIYMTRMMIYTFHGPNRTGSKEESHLHEAPWVMTGPLVVLGVLSVIGGWFNLPEANKIGKVGVLDSWLDPVVGEATKRVAEAGGEAAHGASNEMILIVVAVAVAVAGIALAFARLKPQSLVPASQSPEEEGFERVLAHKYYVDEAYDAAVVNPTYQISKRVLWRGIDAGLIDGLLVNGSSALMRGFGWLGSRVQSGAVGTYAWVLVVGVLAVLGAFTLP
jgi:NADH-quinone oxidoreductase subunit L